jgi:asparagine synthase (glutamine-hydrolysing)
LCGIVGILDVSGRFGPAGLGDVCRRMRDTLVHRGPDDGGSWVSEDGRLAFGHRRLAVIDTSPLGHQPMESPAGVLTFNGEIYNFRGLRRELEGQGRHFASQCDSEVLLAGLDRDGAGFLDRVDGMYAFAHWDRRSGRLILARDDFGEKPLYVYRRDGIVAFASELAALAVLPDFDEAVEAGTLACYLCFQYVPAPATIYRSVVKLLPGECVTVDADGSLRTLHRRRFSTGALRTARRPVEELADELEAILIDTLAERLISDVPLGTFLSGGVDSSLVTALAAKRLNRPLTTFSIGFTDHPDSEHLRAREVAHHLGTDHVDEIVRPDIAAMGAFIGGILDEPNGDSSCLPTWLLCRLARRRVTVALSGDGGDELFGGYGRYFATLEEARRGLDGTGFRPGRAYYSSRLLVMPDAALTAMLGAVPPLLAERLAALRRRLDGDPRPLGNLLREADAADYLPGAVLAKVDRMSMQHSLEVRAPLLGRRVAAFAAGLAEEECFRNGSGKAVLKAVARRYLPAAWVDGRKLGFGLPMKGWAEAEVLAATEALLKPGECRLDAWLGRQALDTFLAFQREHRYIYQLWGVLILESWLRTHPARPA